MGVSGNMTANFYSRDRVENVKGTRIDLEGEKLELEELKAAEEMLKSVDGEAYRLYREVNSNDDLDNFEEFKSASALMIAEIEKLEGDLYTEEGKTAEIRRRIKMLAEEYKRKNQDDASAKRVQLEDLKEKLNDDIVKSGLVGEDIEQIERIKNKVKTDLAFAIHQREVEGIAKELSKQAERNKTIASFLVTHGHIFATAAGKLADENNPQDKLHSLRQIKMHIDHAKKYAQSDKVAAMKKIHETIDNQFITSSSTLINMHRDSLLNRYS